MVLGIVVGLIFYFTGTASVAEDYIKPFGTIFINLLKFIVVPIVVLSMISGIISMGDMKKLGSVGWKAVTYFLCTTAIACSIGLLIASLFNKAGWFPALPLEEGVEWSSPASIAFMDTLVNVFPSNLWSSFSSANMLQVIVISLLIGGGILASGERGKPVVSLVMSLADVFGSIMNFIIKLSPIGVFTMIAGCCHSRCQHSWSHCFGFVLCLSRLHPPCNHRLLVFGQAFFKHQSH